MKRILPTAAALLLAACLSSTARGQPRSVVVAARDEPDWTIKVDLPPPPGFIHGLQRYAPAGYHDVRRLRIQLTRLLTMVSGRWVPDTTSFETVFARLNQLPREQQNRAMLYALAGPVAMKAQSWTHGFFRRHKIPLLEPHAQGIRLKPLRLSSLLRTWYEVRLNRYTYTYLQLPRWRATVYHARSPTYWSKGLWWGISRTYSLSLQRSGGRGWKSLSLSVYRYSNSSLAYAQIDRIETRWRSYWRIALRWEWIASP